MLMLTLLFTQNTQCKVIDDGPWRLWDCGFRAVARVLACLQGGGRWTLAKTEYADFLHLTSLLLMSSEQVNPSQKRFLTMSCWLHRGSSGSMGSCCTAWLSRLGRAFVV